jgi:hypothetical protein
VGDKRRDERASHLDWVLCCFRDSDVASYSGFQAAHAVTTCPRSSSLLESREYAGNLTHIFLHPQ